ncbi:MAG: site-specific integrase [Campylobacterota bacterium]|nr:site-specific integrase [Campylobacterota bacterium]
MRLRTLNKRIPTKVNGVFYKEIIDDKNKVVDKVFLIRYRDKNKDKLVTIGKYSQGIRINYCKKKRDDILNHIRLGEVPTTIKAKRVDKDVITFDMIANTYFEYAKLHNRTYRNTLLRFNMHIKPILGHMDMYAVKLNDIEQIQKDKIKNLSPRSVNSLIQIINTIYNFAISRDIFEKVNPVTKVKALKMDNNREKFLSLEEIKKLEDEIKDDRQLTLFVKMALCTGGRISSVLNIRKKDINLTTQVVNLKDFKMGTTYKAFIPDSLVATLEERLEEIDSDDEVINTKGCKSLMSNVSKSMRPILNRLFNQGLDKDDRKNRTVVHTLRHTFASHLAINGTPIFTIQKLLNHKDIAMTMRYAKLAPDSGRDFVNGLYK